MQFCEKLKYFRDERAFTQDRLASLIGVTLSTLNRWENGANFPRCENIKRLANALEINAADFLDADNKDESEITEIKKASILQKKEKETNEKAKKAYLEALKSDEKLKNTDVNTDKDAHLTAGKEAFEKYFQYASAQREVLINNAYSDYQAFQSDADFMMDLFRKLSPIGREKVFRFIQKYLFLDDENITADFRDKITEE